VSDRVREGLFSSLGDAVESARVLDVFAGTGALGIEALSRGAAHARFVDRSSASIRAIRENLRRTQFEDRATITHGEALSTLMDDDNSSSPAYDLARADPPYEHPLEAVSATLAALVGGRLRAGGACVLTRPTRSSTPVIPLHWGVSRRLEYGDTAVLILREA
jgi:16S rRNA (guanine966-N2)-methyltransferase